MSIHCLSDPFDTSAFKTPEPEKSEEEKFPEPEDPFDLSHCRTPEPEYQKDLLTSLDNDEDTSNLGNVTEAVVIVPTAVVADPFNTDIASEVLPNKGDPFDTAHVKGGIGRAEIKALEEEFLDPECEFDPREGTKAPTKIVAAGIHISPHIQIQLHFTTTHSSSYQNKVTGMLKEGG